MTYGWFLSNGRRVYGIVIGYVAETVLIEDVADYRVRHVVPVTDWHGTDTVKAA